LFYTEPYKKAIADFKVYPKERGIEYTALGLCGEVGEICNEIKKSIRNDNGLITPERKEKLIDELGDVLWYLQALADETGIDLNEVAVRNIEKLTKRKSDNNLKHE
jgi:NTP pyrophosphatase (non-canonical NTP hydrolase)